MSSVCVSARDREREREKNRQRERVNEWTIPMVWFTIGAESAKRFAAEANGFAFPLGLSFSLLLNFPFEFCFPVFVFLLLSFFICFVSS